MQVQGVRDLTVNALSARFATITFSYSGATDNLARQLASRNLALENRGGGWVLRSN